MRIYYAPEALEDLQHIKDTIVVEFDDLELAEKVVRDIVKNIRNLEVFPEMGTKLQISTSINTGYRYLFCRHNYCFYRIEEDVIRIVRILHERQEFIRILFGITEE